MKRGGPAHPKTLHLAAILHLTKYEAVGVLECLFHWAGAYARRGDIGKFPDAAIADGIGWKGDPAQLVAALVESRWLTRCDCHRLRIHDWHEHADQAVKKTKDVSSRGFLECYTSILPPSKGRKKDSGGKPSADSRHKTHDSRRKTPGTGAVSAKKPWTSEAGDDHREFLGEPSFERIGKALGPYVKDHGWPTIRPIWRDACKAAAGWVQPSRFTPELFVRTLNAEINKRPKPVDPDAPPPPKLKALLPSRAATIEEIRAAQGGE
jgi:hypothetical protein